MDETVEELGPPVPVEPEPDGAVGSDPEPKGKVFCPADPEPELLLLPVATLVGVLLPGRQTA